MPQVKVPCEINGCRSFGINGTSLCRLHTKNKNAKRCQSCNALAQEGSVLCHKHLRKNAQEKDLNRCQAYLCNQTDNLQEAFGKRLCPQHVQEFSMIKEMPPGGPLLW